MRNEEIQRAIEFIIQQQAKYEARFEQDEARIARLEQSFRILVELAQSMDERSDTIDNELSTLHGNMSTLSRTMNELAQRTITDESRLMRLEESFKMLVELAHRHG